MSYTVAWQPAAQGHLATIWTTAPDRAAVSAASNRIDDILRRDPYTQSDPGPDQGRILRVPPLAVGFDVSDADRLVTVWAAWRIP